MSEAKTNIINETEDQDRYMTFRIGKELYGTDISNVIEIIGIQEFTQLPEVNDYIKGVINLRGQVIPIINLRIRFGLEEIPFDDRTCIIIIKHFENMIGVIVDSVQEVLEISSDKIEPAPKTSKGQKGKFLSAFGKHKDLLVMLIDPNIIFDRTIE